jgi:hypothetical protein
VRNTGGCITGLQDWRTSASQKGNSMSWQRSC